VSGFWEAPNDYQYEPQTSSGSAHSASGETPDYDAVEALRSVVEEITRKPVKRECRKIGFY
jgi:hypothetical protein